MYEIIDKSIKDYEEKFINLSDQIWDYAELAYREEESSKAQKDLLRELEFEIEEEVGGIKTAFIAKYGSGKPVIGYLGEFDALPGLSQEADKLEQCPVEENGSGHGCGHQLLGTGALAAAVGLKEYIKEKNIQGTVIYYGCPAEEGGGGKVFMERENVFEDADVCLTWHPYDISVGASSSLASAKIYYNFTGKSAHAAIAPHLGRSALDSVELMNVGVNYLREHIIPEARIHYAITDSGGTAPNVVQSKAQVYYYVRTPHNDQLNEIIERVTNVAKGAALMCETEVDVQLISSYADIINNKTLDNLVYKHMQEIYPLDYTEEELKYAEKYYELGNVESIKMYKGMASKFIGEEGVKLFDGPMAKGYFPPNPLKMGSTDVGDVSWNRPTTWLSGQTYALGTGVHTWQAVAQGKSSIAHKGMLAISNILARTGVDILENPELVDDANKDLEKSLAGRKYESLIPKDLAPGLGYIY